MQFVVDGFYIFYMLETQGSSTISLKFKTTQKCVVKTFLCFIRNLFLLNIVTNRHIALFEWSPFIRIDCSHTHTSSFKHMEETENKIKMFETPDIIAQYTLAHYPLFG